MVQVLTFHHRVRNMKDIVDSINKIAKTYQAGCLAFFGGWFGGIADGTPRIESVGCESDKLKIKFSEGEILEIVDPEDIEILDDAIVIWRASALDWYWNLYGQKPSRENRCHYRFRVLDGEVRCTTNTSYTMIPKEGEPAFEMAWYVPSGQGKAPYHRERGMVRGKV